MYEGDKEDLDASSVRAMEHHPVRFHGQRSLFVWRPTNRRAIARFTPEQVAQIV